MIIRGSGNKRTDGHWRIQKVATDAGKHRQKSESWREVEPTLQTWEGPRKRCKGARMGGPGSAGFLGFGGALGICEGSDYAACRGDGSGRWGLPSRESGPSPMRFTFSTG